MYLGASHHATRLGIEAQGKARSHVYVVFCREPLGDPQGWHHALFLASLGSKLVRHLEPNFHRVALARVNGVQGHILMHTVLLLRSDVST